MSYVLAYVAVWTSSSSAWILAQCFLRQVYIQPITWVSNFTLMSMALVVRVSGSSAVHWLHLSYPEIGAWHVDAWKQVEYGVKARFMSILVEVAYTDSMTSTDVQVDEQLHLDLLGTTLSFAVSFLPSLLPHETTFDCDNVFEGELMITYTSCAVTISMLLKKVYSSE